jgi:hypothetical protein
MSFILTWTVCTLYVFNILQTLVTCTFQYRPWTGSIKPSLQHFQFCCVGLPFRDSVFLYFIVTSVLFVPCGGCKRYTRTFNQWCYIFDPWRSFSTTLLLCIHVVLLVSSIWPISTWVVPVFPLEYCIITLRICCLIFKFVFWRLICDLQAS